MNSRLQTDIVRAILESRGLTVKSEVPLGKGLWKGIRADFVVDGIYEYPDGLAVECKWQDSSGSASEKIAYTVLNIQRCYPIPAILLCSGAELDQALAWAKEETNEQLIAAMGTDEFIAWASRISRDSPSE